MSKDFKKYLVEGYLPTIGIECHVQLKTKTKLFGVVSNDARGAEPNTLVDQVCFGLPGALPVLNKEAIHLASKAAFALNTKPQKFSKFDRKHYFYADLPKGYQITQLDEPIIVGGYIDILLSDYTTKRINITRAHLEEDAGKSTHPAGVDYSLVDLNRAGTPLLEIVSEPEMHNSEEAKAYAKELWLCMKYSGVSDVDLYHGNMRFDVNVSVSKDFAKLGTRSETKNLNSFKSVERAVDYEIKRQIELLEKGKPVVQETRGWLDDKQKTVSQRSKEDAHDYRYFPDPDIPPVVLDDNYVLGVEKEVPIMPGEWRKKLSGVGIDKKAAETLLESQAEFNTNFLDLVSSVEPEQAKTYANWVTNIETPWLRNMVAHSDVIKISNANRENIYSGVYKLTKVGKLNSNHVIYLLKDLFEYYVDGLDIEKHAETRGDIQVSDVDEIEDIVKQILEANPRPVADINNGEMKAIGFLVGQVMKTTQGKVNPEIVQKLIKKQLGV